MKVVVDRSACKGHGQCAFYAPEVFDFDEEGIVVLRIETPGEESIWSKVQKAVIHCPESAIRIE